jgi:hypothetical protein
VGTGGAHLGSERIDLSFNSCRYLSIEGP